jgi:hypothetical protein
MTVQYGTAPVIPEDLWPSLVIGKVYRLKPEDSGGQYVRVDSIDDGIVYASGVYPTIADLEIPIERFYNALAYTGEL